jgi:hypothetical protein
MGPSAGTARVLAPGRIEPAFRRGGIVAVVAVIRARVRARYRSRCHKGCGQYQHKYQAVSHLIRNLPS